MTVCQVFGETQVAWHLPHWPLVCCWRQQIERSGWKWIRKFRRGQRWLQRRPSNFPKLVSQFESDRGACTLHRSFLPQICLDLQWYTHRNHNQRKRSCDAKERGFSRSNDSLGIYCSLLCIHYTLDQGERRQIQTKKIAENGTSPWHKIAMEAAKL